MFTAHCQNVLAKKVCVALFSFFFLAASLSGFYMHPLEAVVDSEHERAFTHIYDHGLWGCNENGEGTSGGGSLPETTEVYRAYLQDFIDQYQIKSVIDVGCGDWLFSQLMNWDNVDYIGYDVVQSVIEKNHAKFGRSNIHFYLGNAITTDLPSADLLICKDVLQHLCNNDVHTFIGQLPKFKYCLITNDVNNRTLTSLNRDIPTGSYRELDLTKPPFNLKGINVLTFKSGSCTKKALLIERSDVSID